MNEENPMYKCIRCESKNIDTLFEIKFVLHDWFLCVDCASMFYDWVIDKNADNGCGFAKEHLLRKYGGKKSPSFGLVEFLTETIKESNNKADGSIPS
jgi:hypothetical protein